jgi:membrane protein
MKTKPDHPALVAALAVAGLALAALGRTPVETSPRRPATATSPRHGRPPGGRTPAPAGDDGHGRTADSPADIPAQGWWDVLKRTAQKISDNRLLTEAAGITFYTLLSLFPGLAALVSLYGLVADPATIADHLSLIAGLIPAGGMDIITTQLRTLTSHGSAGLSFGLILGLLTSLWSANQSMKALADALNVVNEEEEKRGFLQRTAITLAFTLGVILFAILALAAVVAVPIAIAFVGLGALAETLLQWLRWPVLLAVIALLLALTYRYLPSREDAKWRWVSWGSGIAAITWVVASLGFSWYVANFGNYDETYGALGAAIGFMTWIWLSGTVVLAGAQLNAELEMQTARDTTTGPERPMGARGAEPADTVAA